MSDDFAFSFIQNLVEKNYSKSVAGIPELLHARDGQRVFKVNLAEAPALTLRLCTIYRTHERVLADTEALRFLQRAEFPAPRLVLTKNDEPVFLWEAGCWGYAHEFIEGENPDMSLGILTRVGQLLGRLHNLATSEDDYPAQVGWLDELPTSIRQAKAAAKHPIWGKQAVEILETLQALPDLSPLPLGLLHTDVHEGNLLCGPHNKLYLLDWEDAGLGQAIFDLALVLGWNCVWQSPDLAHLLKPNQPPERYIFDEEYSRTLLNAYQSERPLSGVEIGLLGAAVRFVMGWFAARDIEREIDEPGVSDGLAFTNWAIMRSVTPQWDGNLAKWAVEERPTPLQ